MWGAFALTADNGFVKLLTGMLALISLVAAVVLFIVERRRPQA